MPVFRGDGGCQGCSVALETAAVVMGSQLDHGWIGQPVGSACTASKP